jgi:hypothetical protein
LPFARKRGGVLAAERRKFPLKNRFLYYLCDAQVNAWERGFVEARVRGAFNQKKAYQILANNASLR